MPESRKEFVDRYCRDSKITEASFNEWKVALPCACEHGPVEGPHWAAIINKPSFICDHLAFHSPTQSELMEMGTEEIRRELGKEVKP